MLPFELFENWIQVAVESSVSEPNAMVLSTVGPDSKPSSRIVLLRGIDHQGLKFFSNYHSRKGLELEQNPNGSLLFFWPELERQVIVEGIITKTSAEESDQYFASRPLESRINSVLSPQSQEIPGRDFLIERQKELFELPEEEIKRPDHWGGYLMSPVRFEFWQGGAGRLNDRIQYVKQESVWNRSRLAP